MKQIFKKGKVMETVFDKIIKIQFFNHDTKKFEDQAKDAIKKAEDVIIRTQALQDEATLDGENGWCLKLIKKERNNDCIP